VSSSGLPSADTAPLGALVDSAVIKSRAWPQLDTGTGTDQRTVMVCGSGARDASS
jgi:hypothetical protein